MNKPFNFVQRSITLTFLFPVLFTVIVSHPVKAQGPKAVVQEPVKDAGSVFKDDKIIHEFIIKNEGNATLNITDVKPGCGCTTTDYDKTIAAGKSGKIKVVVNPSSFNGPIYKTVTVSTNDAANPELQLAIKATIFSYINSKPGFARYSIIQGEGGTNETKQLITSSDGTNFDITGGESEIPNTKIIYREATTEERLPDVGGKQWTVIITLPDDAAMGPLNSFVHLKTNHPKQKQIDIPISGFVRPLLSAIPASADFGSVTITEPLRKTLNIHNFGTQPINITSVECTIKGIQATSEALNTGREYFIRITIDPSIGKGPVNGKLIIHTDSNKKPVMEVPVKGTIL